MPEFPCEQCGATLTYAPGTSSLVCEYCSHENTIVVAETPIAENDYLQHLEAARAQQETHEVLTVKCSNCAAETTLDPNITSDECAFCGSPIVQTKQSSRQIKPQALLPFQITQKEAQEAFRKWLKGLWFAPNKAKEYGRRESGINGMYIPFWTYDADTDTTYTGLRGVYYYVPESYTTVENGKTVTKTRMVRKTNWYPTSGRVSNDFDDVLVEGANTLPQKYLRALEPWDLENLKPYNDAFLSGFRAESYTIDLESGFGLAKDVMDVTVRQTIRRDIGGDEQQILTKNTTYDDITFKHILLPLWISAYRYKDKTYRFLVNARTGEVQGERPWSWVKITLMVLFIIAIIAIIVVLSKTGNAPDGAF